LESDEFAGVIVLLVEDFVLNNKVTFDSINRRDATTLADIIRELIWLDYFGLFTEICSWSSIMCSHDLLLQ
jgi:hypothetical protein